MADLWRQIITKPSMGDYVKKLDMSSFHIGSRLPVPVSLRQELLHIDGISYRLQREIQILKKLISYDVKIAWTFKNTRAASPQPHAATWPGHYARHRPVLPTYIRHTSRRRPVDDLSRAFASSACKERWDRKKRGKKKVKEKIGQEDQTKKCW
ncbi:hypothetical protein QYE76_019016 [Lolium multiflorum]|uniref:Uncharacterized protein n=1 Tax=Lolium multiflorum TaxID=4521 RepID=A0AAD8VD65_LOLMU|nr:hypothetical protein QYE76_019016 [Lolium multiflorum]